MEPLFLLGIAGVVAASLKVWLIMATRWRQRRPLVEYEPHRPVPWNALDLLAIAGVYAAMNALLFLLFFRRAGTVGELDVPRIAAALAATSLTNLGTAAFAIVWIRQRTGAAWSDLGLRSDRALADVRLGLSTFAAISIPIYLLQIVLSQFVREQHPIIELLKEHQQPWLLALCGVSAVLVAPVTEEFFFRVLFQGWLESLAARPPSEGESPLARSASDESDSHVAAPSSDLPTSPFASGPAATENPYATPTSTFLPPEEASLPFAEQAATYPAAAKTIGGVRWESASIVISSLVFSLLHLGHGADPIPLFFLALTLGYLYQRTGRLLPSVVVHFCLNGCSMLLLWFSLAAGGK